MRYDGDPHDTHPGNEEREDPRDAAPCPRSALLSTVGCDPGLVSGMSGLATAIWMFTLLSVMLLVGYLAAKVIPGEPSDFVLELPPIRLPQFTNILVKTLARVQWYLKEAVSAFHSRNAHPVRWTQSGGSRVHPEGDRSDRGAFSRPSEQGRRGLRDRLPSARLRGLRGSSCWPRKDCLIPSKSWSVSRDDPVRALHRELFHDGEGAGIENGAVYVCVHISLCLRVGGALNWTLRALQVKL